MLSFGYTLLFYNIYAIVRSRGLSPYVGSLHALRQGHPALCSDLIEELRAPIVDSLVTSLLNKMVLTPADFYYAESDEPRAKSEEQSAKGEEPVSVPRAVATGPLSVAKSELNRQSPKTQDQSPDQSEIRNPNSEISHGCYLTDEARRTFVHHFERRVNTLVLHPLAKMRTTWRGCIDLQVTTYIKALRGEIDYYLPLEIR